jgi:alkylated DNA nucleotide flippase Atl1
MAPRRESALAGPAAGGSLTTTRVGQLVMEPVPGRHAEFAALAGVVGGARTVGAPMAPRRTATSWWTSTARVVHDIRGSLQKTTELQTIAK